MGAGAEIKKALLALNRGKGPSRFPPPELVSLAKRVLRARRTGPISDDDVLELIQTFVGNLLDNERKDLMPDAEWFRLPDQQFYGAVRRRLGNLAVDVNPRWPLLRSLRSHVTAVLEEAPFPAAPYGERMPWSLVASGRLSHELVYEAVGYLLRHGEAPRDRKALASALLDAYFPADILQGALESDDDAGPLARQSKAEEVETREHLHALRVHLDKDEYIRQLQTRLTPAEFAVLRLRFDGATQEEIGRLTGCSTATVNGRLAKAQLKLRDWARDDGPTLFSAREVFMSGIHSVLPKGLGPTEVLETLSSGWEERKKANKSSSLKKGRRQT